MENLCKKCKETNKACYLPERTLRLPGTLTSWAGLGNCRNTAVATLIERTCTAKEYLDGYEDAVHITKTAITIEKAFLYDSKEQLGGHTVAGAFFVAACVYLRSAVDRNGGLESLLETIKKLEPETWESYVKGGPEICKNLHYDWSTQTAVNEIYKKLRNYLYEKATDEEGKVLGDCFYGYVSNSIVHSNLNIYGKRQRKEMRLLLSQCYDLLEYTYKVLQDLHVLFVGSEWIIETLPEDAVRSFIFAEYRILQTLKITNAPNPLK